MQEGSAGRSFSIKTEAISSTKASQRRRDENVSIRKEKREEKLRDRRVVKVGVTNTAPVAVMIQQQYNRALLCQKNVAQLQLMNQILNRIDEDDLEKYYEHLFGMDGAVFNILMQAMLVEQLSVDACTSLANFTGKLVNEDYRLNCALHLIEKGHMFHICKTMLDSKTISHEQQYTLWTLVANLTLSCKEAPLILFNSPLFEGGLMSKFMQSLTSAIARPLMDILRFLLETHRNSAETDTRYVLVLPDAMLGACYTALCYNVSQPLEHAMGRYDQLEEDQKEMVPSCLRSLWLIYQISSPQLKAWFVFANHATWPMIVIINKCIFSIGVYAVQHHMISLFNVICAITIENHFIPRKLLETGSVEMFVRACQSTHKTMRWQGLFCLGSFLAESTDFVRISLRPPFQIMDVLIPALKDKNAEVRKGGLYCLMSMFAIADMERNTSMELRQQAEDLMRTLVTEYKVFKYITNYLHSKQDINVCIDVLEMIKIALLWDKPLVMRALDATDGTDSVNRLANDVHSLKGDQCTALYHLASQVDDILSNGGGGGGGGGSSAVKDYMEMDNGLYSF